MEKYPKISIITPNYNKASYLRHTIESVLNQDYPNLEYIIIDGGSTDGSVDIIKEYSDRLAYWVSERDRGVYDAVRKGFKHCTGEIMTWIGSDDMYHPGALRSVAEIFSSHPEIRWLTGATTCYNDEGRTVKASQSRYLNRQDLLTYNYKWIQQESTFWDRELFAEVGEISEDLRLAGDFELWLKFSRVTKLFVTDALLGGFRTSTGDQLSNNLTAYEDEVRKVTEREWELYPADKRLAKHIFMMRRLAALFGFKRGWERSEASKAEVDSHRLWFDRASQSFKI